MEMKDFPTINPKATGKRIAQLRKEQGLSVKDMQDYFGFDAPQAIYKWQSGTTIPSVDNLLGLSVLLGVSMNAILVTSQTNSPRKTDQEPDGSVFFCFFQKGGDQSETWNKKQLPVATAACSSGISKSVMKKRVGSAVRKGGIESSGNSRPGIQK